LHISIKMRKETYQEIIIPEGVTVTIEDGLAIAKGPLGENKKSLNLYKIDLKIEGNKIVIGNKAATKRQKKMINTIAAHLKNMIKGVSEKFEYKLKICFSHFPFTVTMNGNEVEIKNFLGEKISRMVSVPEGADVDIQKDIITVGSIDKEIAGQAAANFEIATKIRGKDTRIFQDGIYITEKCGRAM
jgi:large subunit ribosomal protein L6